MLGSFLALKARKDLEQELSDIHDGAAAEGQRLLPSPRVWLRPSQSPACVAAATINSAILQFGNFD
jgi:hypothetical protein